MSQEILREYVKGLVKAQMDVDSLRDLQGKERQELLKQAKVILGGR